MKQSLYTKISSRYIRLLAFLLCLSMGHSLQAQSLTATGTVHDEQGNPFPGVTVTVKGTTVGTTTNEQGTFTLTHIAGSAPRNC